MKRKRNIAGGGSSSLRLRPHKYEVFLSFRGTDTRDGFLSHLKEALVGKGIKTYMDENSLERGSEIAYSLVEAIRDSEASVVVLSENYGGSWWCLDELVQIIQCRETNGLIVVPVFFRVEPTQVRKQVGKFGEAFSEVKERFKDDEERVNSWAKALSSVADLSGWDSSVVRSEAKLVDEIVKDVKTKLERNPRLRNTVKGLVGIRERVEKIKSLLCISNRHDTLTIGIWGMGGIGKTTLAKEVFNELCSEFEYRCFLDNVRENWKNGKKEQLRNDLLSTLLAEENPYNAQERVSNKKVLVFLDDVSHQEQLESLLGDRGDRFGDGSRVIVTTRDRQMLTYFDADDMLYRVEELNQHESLQLFQMNAFRNKPHSDLDAELSDRVVRYAQGVPLAIKVLGSHLRCKKKENWGREMDKLELLPNDQIQNVLKVSYDGLDEMNKSIFLDVACFFKGQYRESVEAILNGCGFYAETGIDDLVDKSLLTISNNRLWMHDLIQEMGRGIVNSTKKREERSRLWNDENVVHVLKNNIGSKEVEGIFLDTTKIDELNLSPVVFKKMHNLRLLKINGRGKQKLNFHQGLEALPDELRYLNWSHFPLKSLPLKFTPRYLVKLEMQYSQLHQLWNGVPDLSNLKHIDFSFSDNLTRIPDLSLAPNLESVLLYGCTSLVQIPPLSFRTPEQLASKDYTSLEELPPGDLELGGCSSLEVLPKISGHLTRIVLRGTKVKELSETDVSLENLVVLLLERSNLSHLPSGICLSEYITFISLASSPSFNEFPRELPRNISDLDLSETAINYVPSSIEHVAGTLKTLYLSNCISLKTLPANLYKLTKLVEFNLSGCSNLDEIPEKLPPNLQDLDTNRCFLLERVSVSETLAQFHLSDYDYSQSKRFRFCECLKLNENARHNILIEYQVRILRAATMSSVCRQRDIDITFRVPGNEIPQWFNYQSEGPSITISFPENWHSPEYIGFALCVYAEESNFKLIKCDYHYRNINNSPSSKFPGTVFIHIGACMKGNGEILESDHLWMFYMVKNHHRHLDAVEITFGFQFSNHPGRFFIPCPNKVRCGVRLINRKDAEKFGISMEAQQSGNNCDPSEGLDSDSDDADFESESHKSWYSSDTE